MKIRRLALSIGGGLLALSALYFTPSLAQTTISTTTWYTVVNAGNGLCVDDSAGGVANGTHVQQWACIAGSTNQQWQFQSTSGGNYKVVSKNSTTMAWDVTGVSTTVGALIQLWTYGGGANQQWSAVALDSTHVKFVNLNSGMCLDVPGAVTTNGTQLDQYTCNGTGAQSWSLNAVGGSPTNTLTVQPPTNTPAVATATPGSGNGSPWGGTAPNVPGKIMAANFNTGGEGVAYHDVTNPVNNTTSPAFRTTEGVDLENCSDAGCGYDIGWNEAGEWEKYTVNVTTAGTYSIDFRVASGGTGGALHLEIDGANVTGSLAVPATGGWQTWTTVTKAGVSFTTGSHVLRLFVDSAGYNIWYFNIYSPGSATATPTPQITTCTSGADCDSKMTLAEKEGQMAQVHYQALASNSDISTYFLGSLLSGGGEGPTTGNSATDWFNMVNNFQNFALQTRMKIPLLYGIDAVHGNNNVFGATVFPHH